MLLCYDSVTHLLLIQVTAIRAPTKNCRVVDRDKWRHDGSGWRKAVAKQYLEFGS